MPSNVCRCFSVHEEICEECQSVKTRFVCMNFHTIFTAPYLCIAGAGVSLSANVESSPSWC